MEKLKHTHLPTDFFKFSDHEINIFFYDTEKSSVNNKVIFNQNLICFLIEGQKIVFKGNDAIAIKNDTFFLLTSGNSIMSEKLAKNNTYKSVLLFFSDELILNFIKKFKINLAQNTTDTKSVVEFKKDMFIENFEKSLFMLKQVLINNHSLVETKFNEIFFYLLERNNLEVCAILHQILSKNKNNSLNKIIKKHENANLSIQELAFLCNMSISTFKRKFSEIYKTTPKQYFIKLKMEKALLMLRQMHKPSEIFFELGYENLSSFSNEFKKHYGFSPSNYENKI